MRKYLGRFAALAFVALTVSACASRGATFQPIEHIPPGQAIIYLYRPFTIYNPFRLPQPPWNVVHDGTVIATLEENTYIAYVAEPGEVALELNPGIMFPNTETTMLVQAGTVYWVKLDWEMRGLLNLPGLHHTTAADAEEEIATCVRRPGSYLERPRADTPTQAPDPALPTDAQETPTAPTGTAPAVKTTNTEPVSTEEDAESDCETED